MDGGSLCCINRFMLKSTKLLKDLSEDSKVFLISKLVSMHSARNLFFPWSLLGWPIEGTTILESSLETHPLEHKWSRKLSRGVCWKY